MNILITGGSGVIGSKLVKSLCGDNEVTFTFLSHPFFMEGCTRYKLDISERRSTVDLITKIKPEITIHTSALTNVDLCETNKKIANAINIEGTRNVVDACRKVYSKIVYISTSNVFNGEKKIFLENDRPNPVNYYGFTKLMGEKISASSHLPFLILRTDQPYSWVEKWQKKSFIETVLEQFETKNKIQIFKDWYNNPTYIDDFVNATIRLIKQKNEGIYHLVGPDYINRYDWAIKIAKCFKKDHSLIRPILSNEKGLPAKRANTNLSNLIIKRDTKIDFRGVDEGLKQMLQEKDAAYV